MPTQILNGPRIAGSNYFYWSRMRSSNTVKRVKPVGIDILSSPTNYSAESWEATLEPDETYYGPQRPTYGNRIPNMNNIPFAVKQSLEHRAKSGLLEKIKGEKWNLGTFLGELPETQKYMMEVIRRVMTLYTAVRRGKVNKKTLRRMARKGRKYLRRRGLKGSVYDGAGELSSIWLQWRYAVSPMIYDLEDMLSYLYRASTRPLISRAAAGANDRYVFLERGNVATLTPAFSDSYELQGRAVAYFSVDPYTEEFKRLGLINLGVVLWELTPLSFVADMFLPIGDRLAALDAMAGVNLRSSTYSLRVKSVCARPRMTYTQWVRPSGVWIAFPATIGGTWAKGDYYSRFRAFDVIPKFTFSTSPTGRQLIDLVALSRQILL